MWFRRLKKGPSEWNLKVAASLFILVGAVTLCRLIIGLLWKNFPIGLFVGLLLECSLETLETWREELSNFLCNDSGTHPITGRAWGGFSPSSGAVPSFLLFFFLGLSLHVGPRAW